MKKTAHYRSASQVMGIPVQLANAIGSCSDGYPGAALPVFQYTAEQECIVVDHRPQNGQQVLHLAIFEAGAGAAVVETLAQVSINEEPAPQNRQFIQHQVFIICSGNDVIFTTHNGPLRDSRVSVLLNNLIRSFGGFGEAPAFVLQAALDENRYREIMDQGISELDLGIAGFKQTMEYAVQQGRVEQSGLLGVLQSLVMTCPPKSGPF